MCRPPSLALASELPAHNFPLEKYVGRDLISQAAGVRRYHFLAHRRAVFDFAGLVPIGNTPRLSAFPGFNGFSWVDAPS